LIRGLYYETFKGRNCGRNKKKLDCLPLSFASKPNPIFASKAGEAKFNMANSYQFASTTLLAKGWKQMAVANSLAFYVMAIITVIKVI
jgi:hypothetical protein